MLAGKTPEGARWPRSSRCGRTGSTAPPPPPRRKRWHSQWHRHPPPPPSVSTSAAPASRARPSISPPGAIAAERVRIPTPQPATPDAVAAVVKEILDADRRARPGRRHAARRSSSTASSTPPRTSTRLDRHRRRRAVPEGDRPPGRCGQRRRRRRHRRGALRRRARTARASSLLVTLGTGIGSALFVDGTLVPNTELGHLPAPPRRDAEDWAAESVREDDDLSWKDVGPPPRATTSSSSSGSSGRDLIIIGGGVSKKSDKFLPHVRAPHRDRPGAAPQRRRHRRRRAVRPGRLGRRLPARYPSRCPTADPMPPASGWRPSCPPPTWTSSPSTRSAACAWTPSRRPTPDTRARRWASRRWRTRSGSASCASTRPTPSGPTATGSCCPRGTRRRSSGRCST